MVRVSALLHRLTEIGDSLAHSGRGLALLGLGSVGVERARLDEFSDLDFFAIVAPGSKADLLHDLSWLQHVSPVAYHFQNTADGHKLLFADGIFCEFAIFEPDELTAIPYAEGRVVWRAEGFDQPIHRPQKSTPVRPPQPVEWLLGEALTNLYIGLGRYHRGEKLSGQRFVEGYALDRLLDLAPLIEPEQPGFPDAFVAERRFEARFPGLAADLPRFAQGYARVPHSARAIVTFLAAHFPVNAAMHAEVIRLCDLPERA